MDEFISSSLFNTSGISINTTANSTVSCVSQTEIWTQVLGALLFFIVWPFVVVDMKCFPLGRPAAALVGATLMVIFQIVSQPEVYRIEGAMGNLQAVYLLIGMMLISYYFDREGLLRAVTLWIFGKDKERKLYRILWKVCLLAAVLAAFITNDATSLVLTPLLLKEFVRQGRSRKEILPLCLGIATSANIGSASTVFGNPQNAFIASTADNVSLIDFFIAILPAAVVGICINITLLYLIFYRTLFSRKQTNKGHPIGIDEFPTTIAMQDCTTTSKERDNQLLDRQPNGQHYENSHNKPKPKLHFVNETIEVHLPRTLSLQSLDKPVKCNDLHNYYSLSKSVPELISKGELVSVVQRAGNETGLQIEHGNINDNQAQELPQTSVKTKSLKDYSWREICFIVWLMVASIATVILLAIPPPPIVNAVFNLGLIPLGTGIMTMLIDTILNGKPAFDAIHKIDWTVILMFMGLFVWLGGFRNTCIPELLIDGLAPYMNLFTIEGVILFTVIVALGSNIFSNVSLVILIVNRINEFCGSEPCDTPLPGLLLAWVATIAGNFTLIGSITNLIVAEKARSCADYHITFLQYIKFGFVSTVCVMFGCLPIVYFLGRLAL